MFKGNTMHESNPAEEGPEDICLELERRFANIVADPEETAILQSVICDRVEGDYVCGFRLDTEGMKCLKMAGELNRAGVFMTKALFNQIIQSADE